MPSIYVLFVRKKYLKIPYLCHFEKQKDETVYANSTILHIEEIDIRFDTLEIYSSVVNTIDTLKYIMSWFKEFHHNYQRLITHSKKIEDESKYE